MRKILIVDDEFHIRDLIAKYAHLENYETYEAENGKVALDMCEQNEYDLVIMDIMMPELDGFSAVKELRKTSKVPVIMLSARGEEYDKLYGFDLGIDDYVTKPFSPKELIRRVNAVIARYHAADEEVLNIYQYEGLVIDYDAYTVSVDNVRVDLTKKEYDLLVMLIKNINVAVTRFKLLSTIWGISNEMDRTLDTHVKSLRKKIGKYGDLIVTIRRVGYRFETK